MKIGKLFIGTLFVSTLFLSLVEQVQAAQVTRSWIAKEAHSPFNNSGGHSFWMPQLGYKYVVDGAARFTEYDDGTATFTGSLVHKNYSDRKWDFDLSFESISEGFGGPKKELPKNQYVQKGGEVDTNSWWYYDFVTAKSTLTSDSGIYAGKTLYLSDKTNGRFPIQVGVGANGKNTKMGLSTWFNYEGDLEGSGDINVDLHKVPEPTVGFISLALAGLATSSLKKNKK